MSKSPAKSNETSGAWRFIFFMGFVSLFADMTYEGARGMAGPYLLSLGASGAVVGFVSGLGELVGYGLRLVFGALSQRSRRFWFFTLFGYAVNLLAVPLLGLAGSWPVAAGLLVTERLGKSIRAPSKDTLLSHAASAVGHGKGFGFHEAMDQIGAVSGPLLGAWGLAYFGGYRGAFGVLAVPAVITLLILVAARFFFPNPSRFEVESSASISASGKFPPTYWIYLAGAAFLAFGYADFPLVAYHMRKVGVLTDTEVPVAYAVAMGVDAVAALAFGFWLDKVKLKCMPATALLAALAAPLAFSGHKAGCWTGIVLWGAAMGMQESSLKAGIAMLIPKQQRGSAYGIFHAAFGVAWFFGSVAMGWFYDRSLGMVIGLALAAQAFSMLAFAWAGFGGFSKLLFRSERPI